MFKDLDTSEVMTVTGSYVLGLGVLLVEGGLFMLQNKKTLVVGIQNLEGIPYGATLRVKQQVETLNADYFNVGRKKTWNSLNNVMKFLHALRFLAFWRDPFTTYHFSNMKFNKLLRHLQFHNYERVVLTEIWTYPYLKAIQRMKGIKIVVDFHNVESMLQKEIARNPLLTGWKRLMEAWRVWLIMGMERKLVKQAHEVWVCSKKDQMLMLGMYQVNANVVPNKVNVKGIEFIESLTTERSLGYVGCFNYQPNEEAALELLYMIHPRLGGSTLKLIGKNPTDRLKAWGNTRISVKGEIVDITPVIREVRTMAMPIRSGSGTRLKVLEAMAYGIPVVATAKAVEGIDVVDGVHYLQAETPEEFQQSIELLWATPELERDLRVNGRKLVEAQYSW